MPLRFGRSHLELDFDRGRILTSDRHLNISEFEIELKDGDRRDVAMLASASPRLSPSPMRNARRLSAAMRWRKARWQTRYRPDQSRSIRT
jgi:inorganic triphosphatase YgiF